MTNRATALFAGRRLASLWLAPVSAGALIVAAAGPGTAMPSIANRPKQTRAL